MAVFTVGSSKVGADLLEDAAAGLNQGAALSVTAAGSGGSGTSTGGTRAATVSVTSTGAVSGGGGVAVPVLVNSSTPVIPNATNGPTYPTGLAAGDLIVMMYATDATIGAAPSGWTQRGATQVQSGMSVAVWTRSAAGSESGSQIVTLTGTPTKGAALMAAYRAATSGMVAAVQAVSGGVDSNTTSTAISVTGGTSFTTAANDLLVSWLLAVASGGTFSAGPSSLTVTQGTATLGTSTQVVGALTGTSSLYYRLGHRPVTTGGSGAPVLTATANGANSAGAGLFLQLREATPPNNPPTAVIDAAVTTGEPGETITHSGTGSTDTDGTVTGWAWTQTAGTTVTLTGASTANVSYPGPATLAGTTVTLQLVVTDNGGATSSPVTVTDTIGAVTERAVRSGAEVPMFSRAAQ